MAGYNLAHHEPGPAPDGAPLPREGRSWPELAQALRDLKRDDLDWRRGRHADVEVERVAREAYALFMTENGLGLRVFPSLRRMEADLVAMVRHLLGGDASAAGHLTSGAPRASSSPPTRHASGRGNGAPRSPSPRSWPRGRRIPR